MAVISWFSSDFSNIPMGHFTLYFCSTKLLHPTCNPTAEHSVVKFSRNGPERRSTTSSWRSTTSKWRSCTSESRSCT